MGKPAKKVLNNGTNRPTQPYSNKESQLFFNQKQNTPPPEKQEAKENQQPEQPAQEVTLQTTSEFLLAAILQELKTQNMIELLKLKEQEEQKQKELELAEKMQARDKARFEEIRHSMYM
jgi:hypothetical protein